MNVKSFIYLDEYKMYSISSQLFEGLTEYIVENRENKIEEKDTQKGKFGSGRIMADIIQKNETQTEKKFLHDYAYTIFEKELFNLNKVLEIDKDSIDDNITKIEDFSFVKVTGLTVFNDTKMLHEMITNFNEFGSAIGVMQLQEQRNELKNIEKEAGQVKGRNKKFQGQQIVKNSKKQWKDLLISMGLNLDEEFMSNLAYLINHGYNSQFEIQLPFVTPLDNYLVSAILDREHLRVSEQRLIKTYSRQSEKKFTLFGIVTQSSRQSNEQTPMDEFKEAIQKKIDEGELEFNIKQGLMNMIPAMMGIDKNYSGKFDYEYIFEPIALYREL